MVDEGERFVGAVEHDEGIIQKATERHEQYRLVRTGSKGYGNYQALSRWRHGVL